MTSPRGASQARHRAKRSSMYIEARWKGSREGRRDAKAGEVCSSRPGDHAPKSGSGKGRNRQYIVEKERSS